MDFRPISRAEGYVLVHLSQVPEQKRVEVADRVIRLEGLAGTAAIQLKMAALHPVQDPAIEVTVYKARRAGVRW